MNRKNKLLLNSVASLFYQLTTIVCGFILPRFFLSHYGSDVNGLISSITQFLGFITLAECGVGPVIQSTLYKPLAENDMEIISRIVLSAERFFKKIAYIFLGYIAVLMTIYPLLAIDSFDYLFTLVLIFVISVSTFAQYYIGMSYKLLLDADQLGFFQYIIHTISLIINTIVCVLLIQCGASVHIVKLTTSLIFVLQPILLSMIAKRRYKINRNIVLTGEPIKQKWNALAHHISGVVLGNTDVVVLTLFSSLENVSIYAIYHLVVNGVKQIVVSMTNGVRAMFGNMLAKNETEELNYSFDRVEWAIHTIVTFLFSITAVLILPFVRIFTADITDANYLVPLFAYLLTLAQAAYCYRLPYYILINAAGHYKQTQWSAIIEAVINVAVSVVLVFRFGLIGVALGTFAAMTYRTVYLANYLKKNILQRKLYHFIKHLIIDALAVLLLFAAISTFHTFYAMPRNDYFSWFVLAVKVGLLAVVVQIFVNVLFYGKKLKQMLMSISKKNKIKKGFYMFQKQLTISEKLIFITGAAGFIGSNLVMELIRTIPGIHIIGLDNMNDYYDVSIKEYRLAEIEKLAAEHPDCTWEFVKGNIADRALIDGLFEKYHFSVVVNLAAQAGVRYSITNPDVYIESNIIGFYNILEACRGTMNTDHPVEHLVYASSSSVYGTNKKIPYSTDDKVDNPVSLYAATKKSNELMAHAYSKLYNIPSTGLRFFTVYGPAGRPDMAYFGFTNKLLKGDTIEIFNYGNCERDFTYIDDIVEGVKRVMQCAPEKQMGEDGLPLPPYAVYNIGNNSPENLLDFVTILQEELIRAQVLPEDYDFEAHKKLVPMQPGDVPITYADTSALEKDFGFKPSTPLRTGIRKFAEWYHEFYQSKS